MPNLGRWLAAYRSGSWRYDSCPKGTDLTPGHWVEWESPTYGSCLGQIVLPLAQGWVLIAGDRVPKGLAWVRGKLVGGR